MTFPNSWGDVHEMARHFPDARAAMGWASGVMALAGGVAAQAAAPGPIQNAGVVAAFCAVVVALIPALFKDRSEQRVLDAEKRELKEKLARQDVQIAQLQARLADGDERLSSLEKVKPQVESNAQGLAHVTAKADAAFKFLVDQNWIDSGNLPVPVVPIRVLIVEDDVPTGRALAAILGRAGFTTSYAFNVSDAIDRLTGPIPYDWLTLDLRIDGGDGEEVLKALRRFRLSTRVAITTGSQDHRRLKALRVYKPDHIFLKPVNHHELIRTLMSDPCDDEDSGELPTQPPPSDPGEGHGL